MKHRRRSFPSTITSIVMLSPGDAAQSCTDCQPRQFSVNSLEGHEPPSAGTANIQMFAHTFSAQFGFGSKPSVWRRIGNFFSGGPTNWMPWLKASVSPTFSICTNPERVCLKLSQLVCSTAGLGREGSGIIAESAFVQFSCNMSDSPQQSVPLFAPALHRNHRSLRLEVDTRTLHHEVVAEYKQKGWALHVKANANAGPQGAGLDAGEAETHHEQIPQPTTRSCPQWSYQHPRAVFILALLAVRTNCFWNAM